jgi:hypothetical protein
LKKENIFFELGLVECERVKRHQSRKWKMNNSKNVDMKERMQINAFQAKKEIVQMAKE